MKGIRTSSHVPPIANHIPHLKFTLDKSNLNLSVRDVRKQLREGDPSIELAPSALTTADEKTIGVWMMQPGEDLRISKTGSDGWAIGRMRLFVNGRALYDEVFPSGHWLDNSGGHSNVFFIDDYFMRMRSNWINYTALTRPNIVPGYEMRYRVEGLFGDFLTTDSSSLDFRNAGAVNLWTLDGNSWRVNVDLEDVKPGPIPNPDVEVDFDLTVGLAGTFFNVRPNFTVENLNVDYTWPGWGGTALTFMNYDFRPRLNEMMKGFTYRAGSGISIATNGDLHFIPVVFDPGPIIIGAATAVTQGRATSPAAIPADTGSPLVLRVRTGGEIKPLEETTFTAAVRSNLAEDADAKVIFELPAGVNLSNAEIVAEDSAGARRLSPQIDLQDGGASAITLRDRLSADRETTYTLRLTFHHGADGELQVKTRIALEDPAAAEKLTPPSATTYFRSEVGAIRAEGTSIRRPTAVLPESRK